MASLRGVSCDFPSLGLDLELPAGGCAFGARFEARHWGLRGLHGASEDKALLVCPSGLSGWGHTVVLCPFGVSREGNVVFSSRAGQAEGQAGTGRHTALLCSQPRPCRGAQCDAVPQPGLTSLPWLQEHPKRLPGPISAPGWMLRAARGCSPWAEVWGARRERCWHSPSFATVSTEGSAATFQTL